MQETKGKSKIDKKQGTRDLIIIKGNDFGTGFWQEVFR